jgi:aspartyl-tRNA(Asn)/glutamyl-tRNA(Gln) amidotransferase subunit A
VESQFTRRRFGVLAGGALAAHTVSRGAFALAEVSTSPQSAASGDLASLSLAEVATKLRTRQVSSTELTEASLSRIGVYDPKLDAFITVMKDKAMAAAKQADAEIGAGKYRGPLHGVPVAAKDNIDTAGTRTTGASQLFEDRVPTEDAPVIARLRSAGAVIVGKTNLQEFAMGGGETSYWGPARNPWNLLHNTGGSSAGSGAAIAASLCYGALGTDTAGSVRMPASYCGVVGLKPTYGLVPIRGIIPLTVSLDHCGPLTRTVEDTAIMLNTLAGYDKLDITSVDHAKEDYVSGMKQPVKGFRIGIPVGHFDALQPDVAKAVMTAIALLGKMTAGTREVSLPPPGSASALGQLGETYAWHEQYFKTQPNKYMVQERKRLETAQTNHAWSVDYIHALWDLELLRRTVDDSFADVDVVALPTMRIVAPTIEELLKRDAETKPMDPNVASDCGYFNAYGLPAITIPCGFSQTGLPIGLMIAGPHFSESKVLAIANAYEQATDWHKQKPPLTPETTVPPIPGIGG